MNPAYTSLFIFILIILIWLPIRRNRVVKLQQQRKKKGVRRSMPQELIREFIGKVCSVSLMNESFGCTGRIVAVEGNWIRFETKDRNKTVRLINGDMITQIQLMPEKYQNG